MELGENRRKNIVICGEGGAGGALRCGGKMRRLHHFLHTNFGVGGVGFWGQGRLIKRVCGTSCDYRRKSQ